MKKTYFLALAVVIAVFFINVCFIGSGVSYAQSAPDAPSLESLMRRGELALEGGEWSRADEFFERVLDINPEHAPAYLGKLFAELKIKSEADLANHDKPVDDMLNYQRFIRFADERYRAKVAEYNQAIRARSQERERQLKEERDRQLNAERERERQFIAELERQGARRVGSFIQFGGYKWRVLDVQGDKALIITENVVERRPYDVKYINMTWETCDLRRYLNSEFNAKFSKEEQSRIVETRIVNPNTPNGMFGGNDTNDKIFLLSIEEAKKYFGSNSARIAKDASGRASEWWLRSISGPPGITANIKNDGRVNVSGEDGVFGAGVGVRPALWLNVGQPKAVRQPDSTIKFGGYNWRVLEKQGNRALIITEDIIELRPYNVGRKDVTWETCTLRKYLNGEFLSKFSKEEQARIIETRISNPDNLWYDTKGGNDTTDKIFLLSLEEVDRYFGNSGDYLNKRRKDWDVNNNKWIPANGGIVFSNANDSDRITKFENKALWWWLRSPGNVSSNAAYVGRVGYVYVYGYSVNSGAFGLRPALLLNL